MDSRLSISGSSLTCRRYLATLDISARWAAALLLRGLQRSWREARAGVDGANPGGSERGARRAATGAVLCAGSSVPKLGATGPRVSATANKTERPALEGEAGPQRGGPAGCQCSRNLRTFQGILECCVTKFSTLLKTRGHAMRNEKKTQKCSGRQAGPREGSQEGRAVGVPPVQVHGLPLPQALSGAQALAGCTDRSRLHLVMCGRRNAQHWGPSGLPPTELSAEHQRLRSSGSMGERK